MGKYQCPGLPPNCTPNALSINFPQPQAMGAVVLYTVLGDGVLRLMDKETQASTLEPGTQANTSLPIALSSLPTLKLFPWSSTCNPPASATPDPGISIVSSEPGASQPGPRCSPSPSLIVVFVPRGVLHIQDASTHGSERLQILMKDVLNF